MPYNDRLFNLLLDLEDQELQAIWVQALHREPNHNDYAIGSHEWRVNCISMEWRAVHGHTLMNLRRSPHQLAWKRMLIDVADKLNLGMGWSPYRIDDLHTEQDIELAIQRMYDERARRMWAKMSPVEQEQVAQALDQDLDATAASMMKSSRVIGMRSVTVTSLASGISSGLLTGAGALAVAQGATSFVAGGLLGGVLHQLGLWLVVRMFGIWSGAQLVASGGVAAVGGALVSAPAAVVFAAHAVMTTSYRKAIPATLMLLGFHELRRQIENLEGEA